jgi:SAM-dependent methyltransferase
VTSFSPATTVATAERAKPAPLAPDSAPDYLERNRQAWERWAPDQIADGRTAWRGDELAWGIWDTPESELRLFEGVRSGADVVELGSGTAAISAWLAKQGARPVAVDISQGQLATAAQLQREFGISFPLVCANAEKVPFENESFDVAVSEYGASLWCHPHNWLPEAHRLLRPDGLLIFFTNAALLMACTPPAGGVAGTTLRRDYFSKYQVAFPSDEAVEFHAPHGHWVRLLRINGFGLENLVEVRPSRGATPRFPFVSADWARRWPSEEIWVARKSA